MKSPTCCFGVIASESGMPGFGISAVTLGVTLAVTGVVRSVAMVISPSDAADIALWSEEAAAIKSLESENVHNVIILMLKYNSYIL